MMGLEEVFLLCDVRFKLVTMFFFQRRRVTGSSVKVIKIFVPVRVLFCLSLFVSFLFCF